MDQGVAAVAEAEEVGGVGGAAPGEPLDVVDLEVMGRAAVGAAAAVAIEDGSA